MHKQTEPRTGPALSEPRAPQPCCFPRCLSSSPRPRPRLLNWRCQSAGLWPRAAAAPMWGCFRRCLAEGSGRGSALSPVPGLGTHARHGTLRAAPQALRRAARLHCAAGVGRPRRQRWRRTVDAAADSYGRCERVRRLSVGRAFSTVLGRWLIVGRPAPCL